jgi:ribosome-associated translation inhibitor RaiA
MNRRLFVLAVLAVVACGHLAGCSKKIWVLQTPAFYTPDLQTVAVAQFRNQSGHNGAGDIIADKLANALMANGTYTVFNPNDVEALLNQQDLQAALSSDASAGAATGELSKLTNTQALLIGTVTTYAGTTSQTPKQEPIYATDRKGNRYIARYQTVMFTHNEGNVAVTASLVRTADGTTIEATGEAKTASVVAEGAPAPKDPYACVAEAADDVVRQLVEHFAPIRKQISISGSKTIRLASGDKYDNEYPWADEFAIDCERMLVVVMLPPECDRNQFCFTIVRKDQRENLVEETFVWNRANQDRAFQLSPAQIAAAGGGAGEYELKFYSGPEPVIRKKFKIVQPGQ